MHFTVAIFQGCSAKAFFWKTLQYTQEKACAGVSFLIKLKIIIQQV